MSKPTIGVVDAMKFVSILVTAGFAPALETDLRLDYNPLQQSAGYDNPAFKAVRDTDELVQAAQRLEEIERVTKGEVVKEDRTAESKELADSIHEIGEAVSERAEAFKKAEEQSDAMERGVAAKAFEANLAGEIRTADDPSVRIADAGRQCADKIRTNGHTAIDDLGEHPDRSANDLRRQAEDEAKKIESMAENMEKTNEAFQERIKNEPVEKQTELMAARVKEQEKILTEKTDVAIANLSRPEPAHEDPLRKR